MPLTDEQIRAIHDGRIDESFHHGQVQELCVRVLEAEARVKKLEEEIADMKRKKQTDQIIAFGAGALLF